MNEENVKIKKVLKALEDIGLTRDEIDLEKSFTVKLGKFTHCIESGEQLEDTHPRADICVTRNNKNLFIVEVKSDKISISNKDRDQAISYARLLDQIAPFAIVTNGKDWKVYDSITKQEIDKAEVKQKILNSNYEITLPDQSSYEEALKNFLGFSKDNLLAFCKWQVKEYMRELQGSSSERNKKYIEEIYEPSQRLQDAFKDFLNSPEQCFIVSGNSGMGKTCWICNTAYEYLNLDIPVLFYKFIDIERGIFSLLSDDLNWNLSVDLTQIQSIKRFFDLFQHDSIIIFIDGLDEVKPANKARNLITELLRRIENKKVKLAATCKLNSYDDLLEYDGNPTLLSEKIYKGKNVKDYKIDRMEDQQFSAMVDKYRCFYNVSGKFDKKFLDDCTYNPFFLRVAFEVLENDNTPHITYSIKEFFDEYYKKILRRLKENDNEQDVEAILKSIAEAIFEVNEDSIEISHLKNILWNKIGLIPAEQIPNKLFELNILITKEDNETTYISFYFQKFRDYIIAFKALQWQKLSPEEFISRTRNLTFKGLHFEVISLYYLLANEPHKRTFDGELYKNIEDYLNFYQRVLEENFLNIKHLFPPYTKGKIGFAGYIDLVEKRIIEYCFRSIKETESKILLLPFNKNLMKISEDRSRLDMGFGMSLGTRFGNSQLIGMSLSNSADGTKQELFFRDIEETSLFAAGAPFTYSRRSLGGFRKNVDIKKEVLTNEIKFGLDNISEETSLDESHNKELLIELVLAICVKYYSDYLDIQSGKTIHSCLPLKIERIEEAILYNDNYNILMEQYNASQANKEAKDHSEIFHRLTGYKAIKDQAKDLCSKRIYLKSEIKGVTPEYKIRLQKALADLKNMSVTEISSTLIPLPDNEKSGNYYINDWKFNTLTLFIQKFYKTYLDEYKILVEHNFPQLCNFLPFYKEMPFKFFVNIHKNYEGSYGISIYECKDNYTNENSVEYYSEYDITLIKRDNFLMKNKLLYMNKEYEIYNPEQNDYLNHFLSINNLGLRSLIYERLEKDLTSLLNNELAKKYGTRLNVSAGPSCISGKSFKFLENSQKIRLHINS